MRRTMKTAWPATKRAESRYHHGNDTRTGHAQRQVGENDASAALTGEHDMQILLVAFCAIAGIWIVVLWGSRYLGPR
jgi:hypothetical protein